jgi:hypothetical protein
MGWLDRFLRSDRKMESRTVSSVSPPPLPMAQVRDKLVELIQCELNANRLSTATAIAQLARERGLGEAVQSLMSLAPPSRQAKEVLGSATADHLTLAEAYRLLNDDKTAELYYRNALALEGDVPIAHAGLASLQLRGDNYLAWLDRLYAARSPETMIEIGVDRGESLARVKPPTIAIGVDPNPSIGYPLAAETHLFCETSDSFFSRRGPDELLNGRPFDVAFIDGLHLYEQALMDFLNVEKYCDRRSIVLFHDTIPLDEITQRRSVSDDFRSSPDSVAKRF